LGSDSITDTLIFIVGSTTAVVFAIIQTMSTATGWPSGVCAGRKRVWRMTSMTACSLTSSSRELALPSRPASSSS